VRTGRENMMKGGNQEGKTIPDFKFSLSGVDTKCEKWLADYLI
jgi:hypothetical protein